MTLEELRVEAEKFFEWPSDTKVHVTLTSALIFAQLMMQKERDNLKRPAPCERFCEATAFKAEIKRLRGAVRRFCEFNKDIPECEKDTPVIRELFYISAQ